MIDFLRELSFWYNLIFTVPIILVILYLLLQVFGLALNFGMDTDTDAGDVDIDADADADVDVDTDVDADVDSDSDILPPFERALAFINIGKVPLTIIIATFFLFWGITGFACNRIIQRVFSSFPSAFIFASCGAAFFVGIVATKFLSGIIAKLVPEIETYSSNNETLLGGVAQVVSGQVTSKFGRAKIRDQHGNFLTIYCRVPEGKETPNRGDEVLLIDYDSTRNMFEVMKMGPESNME